MAPATRHFSKLFRHGFLGIEGSKSSSLKKNIVVANGYPEIGLSCHSMREIQKKIIIFRDILDLPNFNGPLSLEELMFITACDLHKLYPEIIPDIPQMEAMGINLLQRLMYFHMSIRCLPKAWRRNPEEFTAFHHESFEKPENITLDETARLVVQTIDHLVSSSIDQFNMVINTDGSSDECNNFGCSSPLSPVSVLPEPVVNSPKSDTTMSYSHAPLPPMGVQESRKLDTMLLKNSTAELPISAAKIASSLQYPNPSNGHEEKNTPEVAVQHMKPVAPTGTQQGDNFATTPKLVSVKAPPPPPPLPLAWPTSSALLPSSPSMPLPLPKGPNPPPPPPPFATSRSLRAKKATTKLKRSNNMGSLYRLLKVKVEGCNHSGKSSFGRRTQIGVSSSGTKGMSEALAEMTMRSVYFRMIEEDVKNHTKSIIELKVLISSFRAKNMPEILDFHKHVEAQLENLTDESQVLARFEGFPMKKLEALRSAATLYSKLNSVLNTLETWRIAAPVGKLLDEVDRYFTKIKGEVDALERVKDEESKTFKIHDVHFDFDILVRIKESMVDVSSDCIELALKERRKEKEGSGEKGKEVMSGKMLWRAFQLAFRVYTFAGGHDDRAEDLTRELAHEIQGV